MKNVFFGIMISLLSGLCSFGQESGGISGILLDRLTSEPLFGVRVTAGGKVTRSDENGAFNLSLLPGTCNIRFNRYGLQTVEVPGIRITEGDTVLLDTTLMPVPVPVDGVFVNDYVSWCEVYWSSSGPNIYEKSNDDGSFDDVFVNQEAGSQVAVKYANDYDHVVGGRIFVGDSAFPGPFLGTDFLVRVYDDAGTAGLPGNTLDEDTVKVEQYGWVGFDSLDALALTDSYYLGMCQLYDSPGCAPVGCSNLPANSSSLMKPGECNWSPFPYGNAMIRPWVSAPHDSLRIVSFRVARFTNFDTNGNPGTLTELASTGNSYYNDYAWQGMGWCAYGVKALYNNGEYSKYKISKIYFGTGAINVSVLVNQSGSSTDGATHIKIVGQTLPFREYSELLQTPGTAGFSGLFNGKYKVEIYKPGYNKFVLDSLEIVSDTLFEFTLQEDLHPVQNLRANAFTGLLEWGPENITQFSWHCDTPSTCHSVTTPELNLTVAEHWTLTAVYNTPGTEQATVDYSTDHGRTWAEFYQLTPQETLDTVEIDLSSFSGVNGEAEIMFQVHDSCGEPYYLDLREVRIWSPDLWMHPEHYIISLNGESAGSSDSAFYLLTSLVNGNTYRAGVYAEYSTGVTDTVFTEFTYRQLFMPENFTGYEDGDTLRFTWSLPQGSWDSRQQKQTYPDALAGYILRFESREISTQFEINDPLDTTFSTHRSVCDTINVTLTAIYDISGYGFPGETLESQTAGPVVFNAFGAVTGEFKEDWSSMDFYQNCWDIEGNGMAIISDQGNPGPALVFQNIDHPYSAILLSYPILIPQIIHAKLRLDFDLNLETSGQSGNEVVEFQVNSEGFIHWDMVQGVSNSLGNLDWLHFSLDLTGIVITDIFRLRLEFYGNGGVPVEWTIDNIHIYNLCAGPESINAQLASENEVSLSWTSPGQKAPARGFTGYRIFREFNGAGFSLLTETTDTTLTDLVNTGGTYCYYVTSYYDDQGIICESPASDTACIISYLGEKDNFQKSRVVCYPNPAGEYVIIESEEEIKSISLFNALGTKIITLENPGRFIRIDLPGINSGIYLIRVDLTEDVYLKKIIHR